LAAGVLIGPSVGIARADTIQLAPGAELTVLFTIPGISPGDPAAFFPTTIGLELVGSVPPGSATSGIPGSSENYYSGILLQGSLQSTSGSVSLPLFDADAWRLGLPMGDLVADATPGGMAMIYADVPVSVSASDSIFGNSGQAEFVIQNLGGQLAVGLGPGYSIANAILVPLSADNGGIQTAGYVEGTTITRQSIDPSSTTVTAVPEPAPLGVAAGGGALLFWLRRRMASGRNDRKIRL
jgi:hypothetical protein